MARLSRSIVAGLVLCVTGTVLLAAPASTSVDLGIARSDGDGRAEEQGFVDRINALRTSKGLSALAVDPELTAQARIWSQTMSDAGKIFHSSDLSGGITADWQKLGENVGVGGTVDALFSAFVASPKHYENLVDPSYRFIGVGVVWDGNRMFTAHRFMAVFPPHAATTAAPARTPTPAPTAPPTTASRAARAGRVEPPTTAPRALAATDPTSTTTPPASSAGSGDPAGTSSTLTPGPRPPEVSRLVAEMAALDVYLR